jgi:hypothetical protein
MADALKVVEPGVILASSGALDAFYATVPPSIAYIHAARTLNQDRARQYSAGALLHVVDLTLGEKVSLPSDVRSGMINNLREFDKNTVATAVVFLGGGFRAATVRAMGASLVMVAGLAGEVKFFSSIADASAFLRRFHPQLQGTLPSPATIEALVAEMRAQAVSTMPGVQA